MFNLKDKKGAIPALVMSILAIVGVVAIVLFSMSYFGGSQKGVGLSAVPQQPALGGSLGNTINLVDKTTVTLGSWDFYQIGTNAGTAHLLLERKDIKGNVKARNIVYADDGTATFAPGDTYKVLLGNVTLASTFTAGTTYYPLYQTGSVPSGASATGDYAISGGQYRAAGNTQLTYTFVNYQGTVNSAAALTTSDDKTIKWTLQPNPNQCVGNPDTQGQNIMTYYYNSSIFSTVTQYNDNGQGTSATTAQSSTGTPNAPQSLTGSNGDLTRYSKVSYEFPTICGPGTLTKWVRLQTGSGTEPATEDNVSMAVSDVTWGYNTLTYDLIKGYQNNDGTDLGVTDFLITTGLLVS